MSLAIYFQYMFSSLLGTVRGIRDEGMPQVRHSNLRGNLYIQFDVEFPDNAFLEEEDLKVSSQ